MPSTLTMASLRVGDDRGQLLRPPVCRDATPPHARRGFHRERPRCGSPARPSVRATERKIEIDGKRRAGLAASSMKISSTSPRAPKPASDWRKIAARRRPTNRPNSVFRRVPPSEAGPVAESAVDPRKGPVEREHGQSARSEIEHVFDIHATGMLRTSSLRGPSEKDRWFLNAFNVNGL